MVDFRIVQVKHKRKRRRPRQHKRKSYYRKGRPVSSSMVNKGVKAGIVIGAGAIKGLNEWRKKRAEQQAIAEQQRKIKEEQERQEAEQIREKMEREKKEQDYQIAQRKAQEQKQEQQNKVITIQERKKEIEKDYNSV